VSICFGAERLVRPRPAGAAKLRTPPSADARALSLWSHDIGTPRTADALANAPAESRAPASRSGSTLEDRAQPMGRGPTACGVCTRSATTVDALVHRKAVSVPGGGAFGRSKRLGAQRRGSPRVSPCATTSGMLTAKGATEPKARRNPKPEATRSPGERKIGQAPPGTQHERLRYRRFNGDSAAE
jgi:hypothetical protein